MSEASGGWYRWHNNSLILNCRIQPRAGKDAFADVLGGQIKIRISAPPVDGKANTHLIKFLAGEFAVPQQNISIIKGESNRQKLVIIHNPCRLPVLSGLQAPQTARREP